MQDDRRLADQVVELQRLDEIGVPDHRAVGDGEVAAAIGHAGDLAQPLVEHCGRAEDRAVILHRALHREADRTGLEPAAGAAHAVEPGDRGVGRIARQRGVRGPGLDDLGGALGRGAAEHYEVEERVGAEAGGAVHRDAGRLADRHQPGHDALGVAWRRVQYLAMNIGRDAAHVVMRGRQYRDRLRASRRPRRKSWRSRKCREAAGAAAPDRGAPDAGGCGRRCGPQPRPSRISIAIARATTSREARSLVVGA